MSNVTKDSTLMCVRITEPAFAQVGCSMAQIQERVRRKATRMFADKLFEEGQVVVQSMGHQFFGGPDVTYEVELTLVPVAEHKKQVQMLQDELVSVLRQLHAAQETLDAQARKIRNVKEALEAKL